MTGVVFFRMGSYFGSYLATLRPFVSIVILDAYRSVCRIGRIIHTLYVRAHACAHACVGFSVKYVQYDPVDERALSRLITAGRIHQKYVQHYDPWGAITTPTPPRQGLPHLNNQESTMWKCTTVPADSREGR